MISFQEFGQWGRFGNQLFEYAFLRSAARRLGVKFYCPHWVGDELFDLDDAAERASEPVGITKRFTIRTEDTEFSQQAMEIEDGTDIAGFFQCEKYYDDKEEVRRWFKFKDNAAKIPEEYAAIDFSESVSVSVRMGDYNAQRYIFPLPRISFYREAMQRVRTKKHVLVFSDEPSLARDYLDCINDGNMIFIDGPTDHDQFFMITQCRDNILANSSFAWWGAWLSNKSDKIVIMPKNWYRPGCGRSGEALLCDGWQAIQSSNPIIDHKLMWLIKRQVGWKMNRLRRLLSLVPYQS